MPDDASGLNSRHWQQVDRADSPEFFIAYLDKAATGLRTARVAMMRALDVSPGHSVLDIGSGTGEFLIELAGAVPGLRAVGIDSSRALVRTAALRAQAAGAAADFRLGDAERLDFADDSFDRVNCSRVLIHLENPGAAVREMARVLSPGGRLAIWEPDFDALMIDSDDLATSTAVRRRLIARLQNPDIGRRLHRLVLGAGLRIVDVSGEARPVPTLQHAAEQFHLLDHLNAAVASGEVTPAAAAAWRAGLEAADTRGQLFVSPVAFRVLAGKP